MKAQTKIIITAATLILFMLVLPWAAITLAEGLATTGLWFFAFFALNPLVVIALSIMAGTDLPKLWWIPFAIAALFPLLFGIAIGEFVLDLYVYSVIYLPLGLVTMLGTHFGKKLFQWRKDGK